jgi:transposase
MTTPEDKQSEKRFTREALRALSKEQLIDIILLQQEQIETLMKQAARVQVLEAQVEELKRRLDLDSHNSSKPPSSDGPGAEPRKSKGGGKRKPGGQPGHKGHHRELLPVEQVDQITGLKPHACQHCGGKLDGQDPQPERHQVWEIPPIEPYVEEFQLHGLWCPDCGAFTRASLPEGVPAGAFGPRLQATIALLSGVYRLSKRSVESVLADFFHIPISLGSISACEAAVSAALAQPVQEAWEAAQSADVLHADETGWREANSKAWLWVAVTSVATVFMIHAKRGQVAARELLGVFGGVLVSDRWGGYSFYEGPRQWCWAHLRRDFTAFSEYPGRAGEIGAALLEHCNQMFHWWHRVRDGTLKRNTFRQYMWRLRAEVEGLLREGTQCGHEKMERSCKRILKGAKHLWTFVGMAGVEPTNNTAERAVRPAVQWRKGSFGTHSVEGSRFVERIMTAAATCKQHDRNVTEYITQACVARLHGRPAPSLLRVSTETVTQAA